MKCLRQNTAVRIAVGPFLDKTDGVTPETALTVTNCKITMLVDDDDGTATNLIIDAAATASGGDNDMVHVTNDDAGFYDLELTQAQTNYLGRATLSITDAANHCPVFHEFMILSQGVYDKLFGAYSTTRGLAGTALPDAAAEAAGGLFTRGSGAGQINQPANGQVDANLVKLIGSAPTEGGAGRLAAALTKLLDVAAPGPTMNTLALEATLTAMKGVDWSAETLKALYERLGAPAGASMSADIAAVKTDTGAITNLTNNTRVTATVPDELQIPTAASNTQIIHLLLYDEAGNMEAPDSAPTVALANGAGTDRAARLDSTTMALVGTGHYKVVYTNTSTDDNEQLLWTFTVIEGGLTRTFMRQMQLVDIVAADFTADDRTKLNALATDYTTTRAGKLDNLDATVSSRNATAPPTVGQIRTEIETAGGTLALAKTAADAVQVVTDKLATTLVQDGAVYDFTAAALAAAPTGGSGSTIVIKHTNVTLDEA